MPDRWRHVDHPDDERYDHVEIVIQPRWKESELSGDEYRFSYIVKMWRKGQLIQANTFGRMEWAVAAVPYLVEVSGDPGPGSTFDEKAWEKTQELCDQPGCSNEPTVFYERLKPYTRNGHELVKNEYAKEYRQFCDSHKHRGDCALDDADHNYKDIGQDPRTLGGGG